MRLVPHVLIWPLLVSVPGLAGQSAPAGGQLLPQPQAQLAQVAPGTPRARSVFTVGGSITRPEIRTGDQWRYRITDKYTNLTQSVSIEVVTVTESRIHARILQPALDAVLPAATEVIWVWDRDWNPLSQGAIEYQPYYPVLQFPLEPGRQWSGSVQWYSGSGTLRHQLTMQVAGWERVTVPAGSFDAIRISARGHISETGSRNYYAQSGTVSSVIWYAPAIGQIVRKEIDHRDNTPIALGNLSERWELVSYRLK